MELLLVHDAASTPNLRRKSGRGSGSGRQRSPGGDVTVSGAVACGQPYGLLLKCGQVFTRTAEVEPTVRVLHATEPMARGITAGLSTEGHTDPKAGAPKMRRETESSDEDLDEGNGESSKSARKDEAQNLNDPNGASTPQGGDEVYVVWQLWSKTPQDTLSDLDQLPGDGNGDETRRKRRAGAKSHQKDKKAKSDGKRKRTEEDDSSGDEDDDPSREASSQSTVIPSALPREAAQVKFITLESTRGQARFEISFSLDFFHDCQDESFAHLVLIVYLRRGRISNLSRVASDTSHQTGDEDLFRASVSVTVQNPSRGTRGASPSSKHDTDDPSTIEPSTPPVEPSRISAYPPSIVSIPPVPMPPTSPGPSEAASISNLSLRLMAPLEHTDQTPETKGAPAPLPSATRLSRGMTVDDEAWMNALTSTAKEAVLKSLQQGKKAAEARTLDGGNLPSSRSLRRRNPHEGNVDASQSSIMSGTPLHTLPSSATPKVNPQQQGNQRKETVASEVRVDSIQEHARNGPENQSSLRATSSSILLLLHQASKRVDPKFLQRFSLLHAKLFPVFEQFANPATQPTLILILLHALTLTGYCVDLVRFCYWVKDFAGLTTDTIIDQVTDLSAQLVQLQFQQEVEDKLHQGLKSLHAMLSSLIEMISGPVYESYQPEKEAADKAKGKKFISLAKGNAVPWIKEWLKSSYAEMQGQSVAKKMVYKDYLIYCNRVGIEPTTSSVLGKIFREVFPFVSTRRLGSRNNNITYYSNIGPTSNLLVHSASSAQTPSLIPSSSPPQSLQPPSPPSPPIPISIAPAPSQASATRSSRSRSSSLTQTASSTVHSATSPPPPEYINPPTSVSGATGQAYHMGSFRSSSNPGFSYYPSPSYYSSSSSSSSIPPSTAQPSSSTSSPAAPSLAGTPHQRSSTAPPRAQVTPSSTARSTSPTPAAAESLPRSSSGQSRSSEPSVPATSTFPPAYAHSHISAPFAAASTPSSAAGIPPHYYAVPPGKPAQSPIEAPISASPTTAIGAAPSAPLIPPPAYPFIPPSTMALLAALPQLLSPYGIPHAPGLYPAAAAAAASSPSNNAASVLPPGYPAYPPVGYPPYPYHYAAAPTIDPQQSEAAATTLAQLPPAEAIALLAHLQNPLAFVKREAQEAYAPSSEETAPTRSTNGAHKRKTSDGESEEGASSPLVYSRSRRRGGSAEEEAEEECSSQGGDENPPNTKRPRPRSARHQP